jgi:hypothetical protein
MACAAACGAVGAAVAALGLPAVAICNDVGAVGCQAPMGRCAMAPACATLVWLP